MLIDRSSSWVWLGLQLWDWWMTSLQSTKSVITPTCNLYTVQDHSKKDVLHVYLNVYAGVCGRCYEVKCVTGPVYGETILVSRRHRTWSFANQSQPAWYLWIIMVSCMCKFYSSNFPNTVLKVKGVSSNWAEQEQPKAWAIFLLLVIQSKLWVVNTHGLQVRYKHQHLNNNQH